MVDVDTLFTLHIRLLVVLDNFLLHQKLHILLRGFSVVGMIHPVRKSRVYMEKIKPQERTPFARLSARTLQERRIKHIKQKLNIE